MAEPAITSEAIARQRAELDQSLDELRASATLTNWPADAGDWMRERAELAQRAYAMADAMLEARHA